MLILFTCTLGHVTVIGGLRSPAHRMCDHKLMGARASIGTPPASKVKLCKHRCVVDDFRLKGKGLLCCHSAVTLLLVSSRFLCFP